MIVPTTFESSAEFPLGRYKLIALLGQGGMADVYLACTQGPRNFQKLLVVKLARFTGDPLLSAMFLEEARLAAQLSHPNVVQTYEIGEQGTRHYIVMEYLDGGVLSRLRSQTARTSGIPLRISLSILMQVLEGLEYAHDARGNLGNELNIVHRDLSPSNIMVTTQGVVKILDFGIAKAADAQGITHTGKLSGKIGYMPPEQLRGERVDRRADLFSFGVMLAEAAMGEKLWRDAAEPEIALALGHGEIPSIERDAPIDPDLKRICEKALAPRREDRYASAADLKLDLASYIHTIGGPASQKELATFVQMTMADDRAKLQSIIDSQLQQLSMQASWSGETPLSDLPRLHQAPLGSRSSTLTPVPAPAGLRASTQISARHDTVSARHDTVSARHEVDNDDSGKQVIITTEAPNEPRRSRLPLPLPILIGSGAAIVLGIVVFFALRRSSETPPAPPASEPAATQTARLEIVASPSNAELYLDGKPLGLNPYVGTFPRTAQIHVLEVRAAGFKSLTQQFAIDRDLNFRLGLERASDAVVVPPAADGQEPEPAAVMASEQTTTPSTQQRPRTQRAPARKVVKATPVPPTPTVPPPTTTPPPVTTPVETKPTKSGLETDPYATKAKRTLDTDVLENKKTKPTLDRENPWKK